MHRKILSFLIALIGFANIGFAIHPNDQITIGNIIQGYAHAWNQNEGRGFGDNFNEDAIFVNIFGMKFLGKSEIEDRHQQILQSFCKDSKMHILNVQFRELAPEIILAFVDWRVDGFRSPGSDMSSHGESREGTFMQAFVNSDNHWQIVASQNTLKPLNP